MTSKVPLVSPVGRLRAAGQAGRDAVADRVACRPWSRRASRSAPGLARAERARRPRVDVGDVAARRALVEHPDRAAGVRQRRRRVERWPNAIARVAAARPWSRRSRRRCAASGRRRCARAPSAPRARRCAGARERRVDDLDLELARRLVGVLARAAAAAGGEHGDAGRRRRRITARTYHRALGSRAQCPACRCRRASSATGSRCGACARATPARSPPRSARTRSSGIVIGADEDPTENGVRRFIARQPGLRARGEFLGLAVTDETKRPFLGHVMLHTLAWRHKRAEVGYWLVPAARGRGVGAHGGVAARRVGVRGARARAHRDHHDARQRARAGARRRRSASPRRA